MIDGLAMLRTAAILFAVAALGGLTMATLRVLGTPRPPDWMAMGHGLLAAAGLTLALYAAFVLGIPPLAKFAVGVLVVAAIGGASLNLMFHAKQSPLPITLVLAHASIAAIGFAALLICLLAPASAA